MRYRTVLFDLDGTLIDSSPGILNGYRHALKKLGVAADASLINNELIGPPLRLCFDERFHVPQAELEHAIDLYREYYRPKGVYECALYPGVEEGLRALHAAGVRLYLATSKLRTSAELILEHLGLAELFDGIVGCELDGTREAKKDVIGHILQGLPQDGSPVLMVGDRHHDAEGAQNTGVDMAAALWGFGATEEFADFACVMARFESMWKLVEWILGGRA